MNNQYDLVTNALAAKDRLRREDYDCVLMELKIRDRPGRRKSNESNGFTLLKEIQQIKHPTPPPVIIMTSNPDECLNLASELFHHGAKEFLSKPHAAYRRRLENIIRSVVAPFKPIANPRTRRPELAGTSVV